MHYRHSCTLRACINDIIIYLYKIAILHYGMQSFHIIVYLHACLLHARLLHGCDVTHISSIGHFATSISLREHANEPFVDPDSMLRNELVLKTSDNYQ